MINLKCLKLDNYGVTNAEKDYFINL